jgi:hypothetical protein
MFPKFQMSHDTCFQSAYRGNSFDIKWHPLRDCFHLHVLSRTYIAICWVSHPTKTNMYIVIQNENGLIVIENKTIDNGEKS